MNLESMSNQENLNPGLYSWLIDEHDHYERNQKWYIIASITTTLLLIFAVYSGNFLFAVIIITAALTIILRDGQLPPKLKFVINNKGLLIGRQFYDFKEIKDFAIVYKPEDSIKNLYFEFKNPVRHRLSIPLEQNNPLPIREHLLKYLKENRERTEAPLSEQIARFLRI